MKPIECAREQDVIDAVSSGRWPARADEELRAHVAACTICADVAVVACALQDDHADAWREARVPPSGAVWWGLEMRARAEAARAAARPITIVQTIAAACAAVALIVLAGLASPWFRLRLSSFADFAALLDVPRVDVAAMSAAILQGGLPVALAIGAWLVLAPVAIYLVFSED